MAQKMYQTSNFLNNLTLSSSERHKRLQSYANFYVPRHEEPLVQHTNLPFEQNKFVNFGHMNQWKNDQTQMKVNSSLTLKLTPFLKTNAIPGPFQPVTEEPLQYARTSNVRIEHHLIGNSPNYDNIFNKLSQRPKYIKKPYEILRPVNYKGNREILPTKTRLQTLSTTKIDSPNEPFRSVFTYAPHALAQNDDALQQNRLEIIATKNVPTTYSTQIIYGVKLDAFTQKNILKPIQPIVLENKETEINNQYQMTTEYPEITPNDKKLHEKEISKSYLSGTPTKDSFALEQILKHLQESNSLPKTITPSDIDKSIKTLVKILMKLRKQQEFSKPIVVEDGPEEYIDYEDNDCETNTECRENLNKINDEFAADTPEGGTPGKPGVDYPALYDIPQTKFSCKTQRYKGFFADEETNCQVRF